ncbi:hypothetical protein PR048_000327 [Dryococelus australis]|uniref:BAI1-associated protein 3 n=1 Tax=Dryococelus australis TaxID=614101 RepID=A0ABQ9IEB3_9NEOP|nr:hypothetical protein PR048_000327 [Dryococelus australis]
MKNITLLTRLDFNKTFDNVDHNVLLTNQSVIAGNITSDWYKVSASVPQGSVFGPILFTLYINDLPKSITLSQYHFHVDDLQLHRSALPLILSHMLPILSLTLTLLNNGPQNMDSLSIQIKSQAIVISSSKCSIKSLSTALPNIVRDDAIIKIQSNLLIIPFLDYCDTVSSDLTDVQSIRLQNYKIYQFFSFLTKKLVTTFIRTTISYHGYDLTKGKSVSLQTPDYVAENFNFLKSRHGVDTRSKVSMTSLIPRRRTCNDSKSFSVAASRIWNALDKRTLFSHSCCWWECVARSRCRLMTVSLLQMRPALKKAMFHLAWSPESLPASEAITPLLDYLDNHLVTLNAALLQRNFHRILENVWDIVLLELGQQMDGNAGDKVAMFYERLYEALTILVEFFHAEQKGLSLESLKSATYWNVEQRLEYHKSDTEHLVLLYYQQRLQDQAIVDNPEYGVLSVRAYFNHDSLCVEVLNARDVIPLDPNGFSDPFVIIELLPRNVFAHCTEQQTNVQKKTLNPMFDECFEFSVTLEQCRADGAMILFTVMDHDVLTSNDFAGEAFLALGNIPGVADNNSSIDNFHGLKAIDLILMHQKNKNHPILQTLETRLGDKVAQDFVKKQKLRIAT